MANIEMLQALHGDAFILYCQKGENKGVIVVDGGPSKSSQNIVSRFDELDVIDLMILTHYDDDHIGGILDYIIKHKLDRPFPIKEMWLNCAYDVPFSTSSNVSFRQAKMLADELTSINKALIEDGFPSFKWNETILAGQKKCLPFADFFILSPSDNIKKLNDKNYQKYVANLSASSRTQADLNLPLDELASRNKRKPSMGNIDAVINWSSIAFIVKCDTFSALMLGDGYPCTIANSLGVLGYSNDNKLSIDYVKVSHHGSMYNISNDLLDMIDCSNYLISTNGGASCSSHPDRETIANILCHKGRDKNLPVHFYFNYMLRDIVYRGAQFLQHGEEKEYNFILHEDVQLL